MSTAERMKQKKKRGKDERQIGLINADIIVCVCRPSETIQIYDVCLKLTYLMVMVILSKAKQAIKV